MPQGLHARNRNLSEFADDMSHNLGLFANILQNDFNRQDERSAITNHIRDIDGMMTIIAKNVTQIIKADLHDALENAVNSKVRALLAEVNRQGNGGNRNGNDGNNLP